MDVYRTNPGLFNEKANILKALAHPQRLCIAMTLCEKDNLSVTDMQNCLDEAQSTVSQHLVKLKSEKIIVGRREGTTIYYSIHDEEKKHLIQMLVKEFFSNADE